jgi:hypothetical protein
MAVDDDEGPFRTQIREALPGPTFGVRVSADAGTTLGTPIKAHGSAAVAERQ